MQYLFLPWRQSVLYALVFAPAQPALLERGNLTRAGGWLLQESQKIAQEGITLPGTSNRWDFLLPMVTCENAECRLHSLSLLSSSWSHSPIILIVTVCTGVFSSRVFKQSDILIKRMSRVLQMNLNISALIELKNKDLKKRLFCTPDSFKERVKTLYSSRWCCSCLPSNKLRCLGMLSLYKLKTVWEGLEGGSRMQVFISIN